MLPVCSGQGWQFLVVPNLGFMHEQQTLDKFNPDSMKKNFIHSYGKLVACFWLFVACIAATVSCSTTPPSAEDLYKEEASGVVMVLNKFYYDTRLPNGNHVYFSGIGQDGELENLTTDDNEIRQHCGVLTGTAFFISEDGTLITNRHVAQPIIDEDQVKQSMMAIIAYARQLYEAQMQQLSDRYDELENAKEYCYSTDYWGEAMVDEERLQSIQSEQQELQNQFAQLSSARDELNSQADVSAISIRPVSQLGIAYNDSYVANEQDFLQKNPCRVVRVSSEENTDLAMLQLLSASTPDKAYVFAVEKNGGRQSLSDKLQHLLKSPDEDWGQLKMNQQLYMIGFNAGIELANTRRGIKVQMTAGRITQLPDGERLLYSIPTMPGSSGSPVIDEQGRLVGVNFAKLNGTDNFNFGIPLERIRRFVDGR